MEKGTWEQRFSHPGMASRVIDWLLFLDSLGVLITVEIKKSQFSLNFLWLVTQVSPINTNKDKWIDSQRVRPIFFLAEAIDQAPNQQHESMNQIVEKRAKEIITLIRDDAGQLSNEIVETLDSGLRLGHWLYHRKESRENYQDWYSELGINRATTLDYLNLQALGLKDYQKLLSQIDGDRPLTIRDRVAYARRRGWISSPGHGSRTSQMNKTIEQMH